MLVYAWVVRRTEHRPPTEVAARSAAAGLGLGLLIGAAMCAAVIVNIALLDGYRVDGPGSVALLGFMAAAAVTEELLFRGVLFRIIEERAGTYLVLVVTGVLFGASHLLNPHPSLWGAVSIAISAGFMLAACYAATRTLWVPIGLHFGWNFALGGVVGAEVSGNDTPPGLLTSVFSGPEWLTGGGFGPEASVYTPTFGLLLTIVFLWVAHRRGRVVPLRRRGAPATSLAR